MRIDTHPNGCVLSPDIIKAIAKRGHPMNFYTKLTALLPVLYPDFYSRTDSNHNEFILLKTASSQEGPIPHPISDKTQFEAVENHIHIFEEFIGAKHYNAARQIGISIAKNLYQTLETKYPDKAFIVYLTINLHGAIIRFHQIWNDEPVYYDEAVQYDAEVISFHK